MLRLSRLLSDCAVLRMNHPVHVWGWDEPGREVCAGLYREDETDPVAECTCVTDADGRFSLELPGQEPGGPWVLIVSDDAEERVDVWNILFGSVWFISGQSNIDVDMERCRDSYPQIVKDCQDPWLRTYHIDVEADYKGPAEDVRSGSWAMAERNTILAFSATGYFYARALRELQPDIPVGFIQASLGGSRITCWMSREMLEDDLQYAPLLEEMERYADDDYMAQIVKYNETDPVNWKASLMVRDRGCLDAWMDDACWTAGNAAGDVQDIEIPCLFDDTALAGFIGSVWLTRTFDVPTEMAGKSAHLWLGTLVDSDETYINGVKVGETGYQYPPRKYEVPEGLLRTGKNRVTIRLVVESGRGRFTPGKGYFLFNDQGVVNLTGTWQYRIGATSTSPVPPTDQVNWKACGLFNAMAAPCKDYPVNGLVWYQGEANTHIPYDYTELSRRYIEGYRKRWGEQLPYYYVQLPNYDTVLEGEGDWPWLREQQRHILEIPGTAMAVTMDLGEDNDLHPHGKMQIGRRLALAAAHDVYGMDIECTGPVPQHAALTAIDATAGTCIIRLTMTHAQGLYADSCDKGTVVRDFQMVDTDGSLYPCEARIDGEEIILTAAITTTPDHPIRPAALRYAYCDVMHGALIYNAAHLPMSPFILTVENM